MRKGKFDPLDMKTWYPVCGEPYEIETACSILSAVQPDDTLSSAISVRGAVSLLKEVDVKCRAQLDSAADALGGQVGFLQSEKRVV